MVRLMLLLGGLMSSHATDTPTYSAPLIAHAFRLVPGDDIKLKLESYVKDRKLEAVTVLSAVGSVTEAKVRYANQPEPKLLKGHFEVVSLVGTLSASSGSHLHLSLSDGEGKTLGGHLVEGSKVYTTLEVVLGVMSELKFTREPDPRTTYHELKVQDSGGKSNGK